jgi:hypothetical protein
MATNQPPKLAQTNKRGPQGQPIYEPIIGPIHHGTNHPGEATPGGNHIPHNHLWAGQAGKPKR